MVKKLDYASLISTFVAKKMRRLMLDDHSWVIDLGYLCSNASNDFIMKGLFA